MTEYQNTRDCCDPHPEFLFFIPRNFCATTSHYAEQGLPAGEGHTGRRLVGSAPTRATLHLEGGLEAEHRPPLVSIAGYKDYGSEHRSLDRYFGKIPRLKRFLKTEASDSQRSASTGSMDRDDCLRGNFVTSLRAYNS